MNKFYIVTARKFGKLDTHSYNLGVFKKKKKAIDTAESHCTW